MLLVPNARGICRNVMVLRVVIFLVSVCFFAFLFGCCFMRLDVIVACAALYFGCVMLQPYALYGSNFFGISGMKGDGIFLCIMD